MSSLYIYFCSQRLGGIKAQDGPRIRFMTATTGASLGPHSLNASSPALHLVLIFSNPLARPRHPSCSPSRLIQSLARVTTAIGHSPPKCLTLHPVVHGTRLHGGSNGHVSSRHGHCYLRRPHS
jgi:hypothetical protein